jgi:acetyltransferase-like isoleucine patch superfamily enzyme
MYVSARAMVKTKFVSPTSIILGPSVIGENTIIDERVIVGYPSRRSLRTILQNVGSGEFYRILDEASSGARIGGNCHLRPGATIYEGVTLGDNVETGHNIMVREDTVIGEGSIIGTNVIIDGRVRIGKRVRIETGVYIPPETIIEDDVFLGPFVVITNDKYPVSRRLKGPVIKKGAVIGANSILIPGVTIGEEAVVAAGSIVTRDVPPRTVVAGVPAKPLTSRDKYEAKKRIWEGREA